MPIGANKERKEKPLRFLNVFRYCWGMLLFKQVTLRIIAGFFLPLHLYAFAVLC
jgi:hypothetical protein